MLVHHCEVTICTFFQFSKIIWTKTHPHQINGFCGSLLGFARSVRGYFRLQFIGSFFMFFLSSNYLTINPVNDASCQLLEMTELSKPVGTRIDNFKLI